MVTAEATDKGLSNRYSRLPSYNLDGVYVTKPIHRFTMSVAIEPLCFWEVAELKTCYRITNFHNHRPLIIHKETNYTSLYIRPQNISALESAMLHIQMKIYLYHLWNFHSSLYCTVPFVLLSAYIIFTLRESFFSHMRVYVFCRREMSWILLCNVWDLQCGECCACLFISAGQQQLGIELQYLERLFFLFPYENTTCRNRKKHLLWHRFTL